MLVRFKFVENNEYDTVKNNVVEDNETYENLISIDDIQNHVLTLYSTTFIWFAQLNIL